MQDTIYRVRYIVSPVLYQVEKMETSLKLFSETLDEWLAVQKQWMYVLLTGLWRRLLTYCTA